jgi:hypothetical protein
VSPGMRFALLDVFTITRLSSLLLQAPEQLGTPSLKPIKAGYEEITRVVQLPELGAQLACTYFLLRRHSLVQARASASFLLISFSSSCTPLQPRSTSAPNL